MSGKFRVQMLNGLRINNEKKIKQAKKQMELFSIGSQRSEPNQYSNDIRTRTINHPGKKGQF